MMRKRNVDACGEQEDECGFTGEWYYPFSCIRGMELRKKVNTG